MRAAEMPTTIWLALMNALLVFTAARAQPVGVEVPGAPMPIQILAQSPADTTTELQVICLFRSSPENKLHGALIETNEKLGGLLDRLRKPGLFSGDLGETLLVTPPKETFRAKRLLIIGLGESQSFTPLRMQLVGEIVYAEASHLGVAHPFFAPTVLDGGVTKFTTGEVAEQVIRGFLHAAAINKVLQDARATDSDAVLAFTYLAGPKNVNSTRTGIETGIAAAARK